MQPLCHPGAVVEQLCCLGKRAEIHFLYFPTQFPGQLADLVNRLGIVTLVEKPSLCRGRHTQYWRQRIAGDDLNGAHHRVTRVGSVQNLTDARGIIDLKRKDGGTIQRPASRHHTGTGPATYAGLDAEQIIERRRHTAAAGGIGAQRERDLSQGHRHRGAGG